jgi:hypothetical protein
MMIINKFRKNNYHFKSKNLRRKLKIILKILLVIVKNLHKLISKNSLLKNKKFLYLYRFHLNFCKILLI